MIIARHEPQNKVASYTMNKILLKFGLVIVARSWSNSIMQHDITCAGKQNLETTVIPVPTASIGVVTCFQPSQECVACKFRNYNV